MPAFKTDDHCRIYYETHGFEGRKPTIVFLNGTTQTTLYWLPLAKKLKTTHRIVLYDARGQGKSTLGRKGPSLQTHLEDLSGLLDYLDTGPAHLIGLSHGAQVALALGASKTQPIATMILCSLGSAQDRYNQAVIHAWLKALEAGGVAAMAWAALPVVFGRDYLSGHIRWLDKTVAAIVNRNDSRNLSAFLEAMRGYPDPGGFAARIQCPCLVLSGSEDPLVPEASANDLANRCAGRHVPFKHTGHSIPAESPQQFQTVVLDFLKTHSAGS